MLKFAVFAVLCLNAVLGYSVQVQRSEGQCEAVENLQHPDVPSFRWAYFGNIEKLTTSNKLVVKALFRYNMFYNSITFDLDTGFQNLALDISVLLAGKDMKYKIFTKKDGIYRDEGKTAVLDLELGTEFTMEVKLVEVSNNVFGYLISVNGNNLGLFTERPDVPLKQVKYISFINNIQVNSIDICDA